MVLASSKEDRNQQVDENWLKRLVEIRDMHSRYPLTNSRRQRQRIGIARAISKLKL